MNRQLFQQLASQREEALARISILDAELCAESCGIAEKDVPRLHE